MAGGSACSLRRIFAPDQSLSIDEVFNTLGDAVLVCDARHRVRGANPAACQMLDMSESRLLGVPISDVLRPRRSESAEEGWRPTPGSEASDVDLELCPRSGPPIAVAASTRPLRFGDRNAGAVVVARDIRDRLRSERALQETQLRYRALFHNNPSVVFELDTAGALVRVNPTGRRVLGVPLETSLGQVRYSDVVEPEEVPEATAIIESVVAGEPREFEIGVRSPADGRHVLRGVAVPVRDGDRVVGILGVALDVTEERRAKREMEVQRRYFMNLFEAAPEAVVLADIEGTVLRVNSEFSRLFGYPPEEVVGRPLDQLIVPDDPREKGAERDDGASAHEGARFETRRCRKDGTEVEVSLLTRKIQVPGESPQMYVIYRDITDRKEAERRLHDREEELRHAQKLEAVGKLAGGIAHDFNNLVTVINGHARFALDELTPGQALRADLEEIERAGVRAANLTQQLLAFSRRQVLQPQVLDLNAIVRDLHGMLVRLIGEHIRLHTHVDAEEAWVRVDRGQLEQVLVNLVVNARDAMPDGGTLRVDTDDLVLAPDDSLCGAWQLAPGAYLRLTVRDTGTGMDAATAHRAFEPFFTTKERGKGTGLGLSTVFGIVKQSGGYVGFESSPGNGSAFQVVLPRATAPSAASAPEDRARLSRPRDDGRTVLVVEDEAAVRKLAVRVLERRGYRVVSAVNGEDALAVIAEHEGPIGLVVR